LQVSKSRFQPQLIVYNAGTDILDGDPLGRLKVLVPNPFCFHIYKAPKQLPVEQDVPLHDEPFYLTASVLSYKLKVPKTLITGN
jgi:hypothetical protein